MMYFCTLFDSNYLSRGLAMIESLLANTADYHLFVFAFDDEVYRILKVLSLDNVTLVSLSEFEDAELLAVKSDRTPAEYCWTSTSSTILYVLKHYNVAACTYIDADLFFYHSPEVLLNELGNKSILLTEHRYTPENDLTRLSGKYCVQFITFKNDERGLKALQWWRNACLEWCYAREEDGKFGDQKYLDDWTTRFEGVHVLMNLGGGVAPWNIQQYAIEPDANSMKVRFRATNTIHELVFYHFHHLRFYTNGIIDLGDYRLSREVLETIYRPYLQIIEKAQGKANRAGANGPNHGARRFERGWDARINRLKRFVKGRYNFRKTSDYFLNEKGS